VNPAPEVPPDINVPLDALPARRAGVDGVMRRTAFDYSGTGDVRRMVQLSLRPRAAMPRLRTAGHVELWVRGGLLEVDGRVASAGCFVILEPGAEVSLASPYGALLLGWAEAPAEWVDAPGADDPFGFA
jgi:hypothetical protein